jgi:hypothetical protein
MSDAPKKMVIGSMVAAGIVALFALTDLFVSIPFSGTQKLTDILFLICAAIVGYLAYDSYQELR